MAKDSFILYLDHQETFEMLTDEEAGQLIKNIFRYEKTREIPRLNKYLTLAFLPIMQSLDKNREKYEDTCKKNAENIKKRWKNNNTNVYERTKSNTNYTDNDNDNDNEYDHDSDNDNNNDVIGDSCDDGLTEIINFYNYNIGLITPYGIEVLEDFEKEMQKDLIILAMKKSVEANKRSIQYIKGILNNWSKSGIKTVEQAENENKKFVDKAKEEFLNE